jgi:hypothetical protein
MIYGCPPLFTPPRRGGEGGLGQEGSFFLSRLSVTAHPVRGAALDGPFGGLHYLTVGP